VLNQNGHQYERVEEHVVEQKAPSDAQPTLIRRDEDPLEEASFRCGGFCLHVLFFFVNAGGLLRKFSVR
jgi:hypothetical protein